MITLPEFPRDDAKHAATVVSPDAFSEKDEREVLFGKPPGAGLKPHSFLPKSQSCTELIGTGL